MRKVIEIRNEIAKLSQDLGSNMLQQEGTMRLREKVLAAKDKDELQKIVLEVLQQDDVFHTDNIKAIKERSVILENELKEVMRSEDTDKSKPSKK